MHGVVEVRDVRRLSQGAPKIFLVMAHGVYLGGGIAKTTLDGKERFLRLFGDDWKFVRPF